MARPKKLLGSQNGHRTKEEKAQRKKQEAKLYEHEQLDVEDIPYYLDHAAKLEWERIMPLLKQLPISELDRMAVTQYCFYTSVYEKACLELQDKGLIVEDKANPAFQIMVNASKELKSLMSAMGLTINSRLKIVVDNEEEKEDDPFMKMLKEQDNE